MRTSERDLMRRAGAMIVAELEGDTDGYEREIARFDVPQMSRGLLLMATRAASELATTRGDDIRATLGAAATHAGTPLRRSRPGCGLPGFAAAVLGYPLYITFRAAASLRFHGTFTQILVRLCSSWRYWRPCALQSGDDDVGVAAQLVLAESGTDDTAYRDALLALTDPFAVTGGLMQLAPALCRDLATQRSERAHETVERLVGPTH